MSNWQKVYSPPVLIIVLIVGLISSVIFFIIGGTTYGLVAADPEMKNDPEALTIRTCCQVLRVDIVNCFASWSEHKDGRRHSKSYCPYEVTYPSATFPSLPLSEDCTLSLFQKWNDSTQSYQFKTQSTYNKIDQELLGNYTYDGTKIIDLVMNCYLNPSRELVAIHNIYSLKYDHMNRTGIVFLVFGGMALLIAIGYPLFGFALFLTK